MGPGSTLGGRYVLDTPVQEGTAFERWRARDATLEREVVVLCFPAPDDPPTGRAAAALDAARRAAGVEDGRLVRVLDVGRDDATAFVVEEPLPGAQDLAALTADGPLPGEEARRLVGEAAAGLEAARSRGLHHGALDPSALLRLPDGRVKVRGLATQAALLGLDDLDAASASREDAVTLVALAHAALTGTWPGDHAALAVHGEHDGPAGTASGAPRVTLPPAPTSVSGVLPPSEVVSDVPADLDAIARLTLTEGQGPLTPGDLAGQIAPWSRTVVQAPAASRAASGPRSRPTPSAPERAARRATTVLGMSLGGRSRGADADASSEDDDSVEAGRAGAPGAVREPGGTAEQVAGGASARASEQTDVPAGRQTGEPASGAATGGPAARRGRSARPGRPEAPMRMTRDMRVSDTLREEDDELEPPVPLVRVPSRVEKDNAGIALAVVAAVVVLAAVLGIIGVSRIGKGGTPPAAATTTATASASPPPTTTAAPTTSAPTTGAPLAEVAIVQAQPWDPQGDGQEGNASAPRAFDGDPTTAWRSQTYRSAAFGGFQKSGIGLVLDLGQQTAVRQVKVTLVGGSDMSVYVASRESLDGATQIGTSSGQDGTLTFTPPNGGAAQGQLVILWFSKLAPDGQGSYQAQVAEVAVSK